MSWNERPFENKMKKSLVERFKESEGEKIYTDYTYLRDKIIDDNFYNEIKGIEKDLTDHSQRHIENVLDNAYKIMGENPEKFLSALDMYCLGIMILLHDVGNIKGRKYHYQISKIAEVYNYYRKDDRFRQEKQIITKAASKHSGLNSKGTGDTLDELEHTSNLKGEPIKIRDLAAILRFADELAEGQQRTSLFMISNNLYSEESRIFHQYAECTDIYIDRSHGRIAVTLNIDIQKQNFDPIKLRELLEFSYKRILKLDEERRYCKNYSEILGVFKYIDVQYNFTLDGIPIEVDLKPIILKDRYPVPGYISSEDEFSNYIYSTHENYIVDNLIKHIELIFKKEENELS